MYPSVPGTGWLESPRLGHPCSCIFQVLSILIRPLTVLPALQPLGSQGYPMIYQTGHTGVTGGGLAPVLMGMWNHDIYAAQV